MSYIRNRALKRLFHLAQGREFLAQEPIKMPSFLSFQRIAVFPLMLGFAASAAWAGSSSADLPNFQKVDDQVYRGAQPTGAGFQDLAQRGIKTVIDLRNLGEHSQAEEQRLVTAAGMKY